MHRVEAANAGGIDRSFGAAGEHHVGLAEADEVEGVDDGVVGRCAGRNHTVVGTVVAIFHRDVTRRNVGNHLGNEEGVVFRALVLVEGIVSGFFLKGVEAADTGCDNYTHAVFVNVRAFGLETGVLDCLTGRHEGILGVEVELTELAAVKVFVGIEALHLACELGLELGGVEVSDGAGPADTALGGIPGSCDIISQGGDGAHTRYYNTF